MSHFHAVHIYTYIRKILLIITNGELTYVRGFPPFFPMVFVLFPRPFIKQRTAFFLVFFFFNFGFGRGISLICSCTDPANAERKSVYVLKCHYNRRIEVSFSTGLYLYIRFGVFSFCFNFFSTRTHIFNLTF